MLLALALIVGAVVAPGSFSADGQGAAVRVKMKTSFGVAPAKGKKSKYKGRVKAAGVKVRGKHLPAGVSRKSAKRAGRQACLRDWRNGFGSITVRSAARTLGSDTNLNRKLKWSIKARSQQRGTRLKASGPQLFAPARAGGKTFSAQCTRPARARAMP